MKKMALLLVMVCLIGGLMVQPSLAAPAWYKCNITGAGVANGDLMQLIVTEVNQSFGPISVYEPNTDLDANRNLAIALTAISMGQAAWVFTDGVSNGSFNKVVLAP
jgi:hypothetical protein